MELSTAMLHSCIEMTNHQFDATSETSITGAISTQADAPPMKHALNLPVWITKMIFISLSLFSPDDLPVGVLQNLILSCENLYL